MSSSFRHYYICLIKVEFTYNLIIIIMLILKIGSTPNKWGIIVKNIQKYLIIFSMISLVLLSSCSNGKYEATPTPISIAKTSTTSKTPTSSITSTDVPIGITEIANLGKGSANIVEWSPDNQYFAVGGSLGVHIFENDSKKNITNFPKEFVVEIKYSPDGQFIGYTSFNDLTISRLSDEKNVFNIESTQLGDFTFSTDSKLLAYRLGCWNECSDSIIVYDIFNDKEIQRLSTGIESDIVRINSVSFNSDNSLLAGADLDGGIYIWNTSSGELMSMLLDHRNAISEVIFSPNDNDLLVSYSREDGTILFWDIHSNRIINKFNDFQRTIQKLSFSSDGSTVEITTEELFQIIDASTMKILASNEYIDNDVLFLQNLRINEGYIEYINGLAFSPDSHTLATSCLASSPLVLWDIETKQIKGKIDTSAISLKFNHQGNLLATYNGNGNINIWDIQKYIKLYSINFSSLDSYVFSPDDSYIVISSNGKIYFWDFTQDYIFRIIKSNSKINTQLSFSTNEKYISAIDTENFLVNSWNVSTGEIMNTFTLPENPDYNELINFDDDLLAVFFQPGIKNNSVELWNINKGNKIQTFDGINDYMNPVLAYSPNKKVTAISYFYGITFYCTDTGKPIYIHDENFGWIKYSFSSNGKYMAIGDGYGNIRLWDVSRILQAQTCQNP